VRLRTRHAESAYCVSDLCGLRDAEINVMNSEECRQIAAEADTMNSDIEKMTEQIGVRVADEARY